ncbi:V-type ATP synthase subunit F [uncultured Ruminococcus sp.]|uniref:V-type ATP synthase subunit F n=1 Tax=uncultured Ruminococcus sp. TaxID=165186 RepID=UPI00292F1CA6|nr:V-type ATP synthase subunit F [uncultured Ruminococcus sp.]
MRMYLLSDNVDTLMGMRMSGVDGVVLHKEDELREKLGSLIKEKDIAVILITSTLLNMIRDTVYDLKLRLERPLIIEIPDRHGNGRTKDSITKYVKDAIGVDMS